MWRNKVEVNEYLREKGMKKESWLCKFLKWIGLIKEYGISKKEMCKNAKSICNKDCQHCVWHE